MSRKSTRASDKQRINDAATHYTYVQVEAETEGEMPKIKTTISLGGALTNQWKKDGVMYYWPEFRLASSELANLYYFASDLKLIDEASKGADAVFGPIIGKATMKVGNIEKTVPGALMATVKLVGDQISISEADFDDEIPVYEIEYTSKARGETLVSEPFKEDMDVRIGDNVFTVAKSYAPAEYIGYERLMKKNVDAESKGVSTEEYTLEDLHNYLSNPSTVKKEAKKSTKGKTSSIDDLIARVTKSRTEHGTDDYYLDVTDISPNYTRAKVRKPTANHVYALPEGDENHDYFIVNKKTYEAGTATAENFYKFFTDSDKEAMKMLKAAIAANEVLIEPKKKVTKKVKPTAGKTTAGKTVTTTKRPAKKVVKSATSSSSKSSKSSSSGSATSPTTRVVLGKKGTATKSAKSTGSTGSASASTKEKKKPVHTTLRTKPKTKKEE